MKSIFMVWAFLFASLDVFSSDSLYREFLFPDGTVSSKGFFVNGQPDGFWQTFYPDGTVKSQGWRSAGKLDSVWRFYDPTGRPESEIYYLAGLKNGFFSKYATDTACDTSITYLVSRELFVNDIRAGISYYYTFPGYLSQTVHYVDNKKHGTSFYYDSLGVVSAYAHYLNGVLIAHHLVNKRDSLGNKTGIWKEFHSNGAVKSEQVFHAGVLNGYAKEYDRNGQVVSARLFRSGSLLSDSLVAGIYDEPVEYIDVYPNGSPRHRGAFRDSIPIGTHRYYDSAGTVTKTIIFSPDGDKLSDGILSDEGYEHGFWKYYYPDGTLSHQGNFRRGQQIGQWQYYYPSGILQNEGTFVSGKYSGVWTFYHPSGAVARTLEYSHGKENGQCTEYDDSLGIVASGMYIDGLREGVWTFSSGDQFQTGSYRMGERHGLWKYHYLYNNKLRFIGEFKLGIPDGKHLYFYDNGSTEREEYWRSGKRVKVWKYYRYHGSLELMFFYKHGKEAHIQYIDDQL